MCDLRFTFDIFRVCSRPKCVKVSGLQPNKV